MQRAGEMAQSVEAHVLHMGPLGLIPCTVTVSQALLGMALSITNSSVNFLT